MTPFSKPDLARLLPIIIVALTSFASEAYTFCESSQLAEGKWVKVTTSEEGLYEISYEKLMEMGFENPRKVGVYGTGAKPLTLNFTNESGTPLINDDISAVGVLHKSDKLYFYASGDTEIKFFPSSSPVPAFRRENKNIYSSSGIYFLTDKDAGPLEMKQADIAISESSENILADAFDFELHEEDLYQNTSRTGQLFWGENLFANNGVNEWNFSLPYLVDGSNARLESIIYPEENLRNVSMNVTLGIRDTDSMTKTVVSTIGSSISFPTLPNMAFDLVLDKSDGKVFTEVSNPAGDFLNMDYWIISYKKSLDGFPGAASTSQENLWIPTASPVRYQFSPSKEVMAIDITSVSNPVLLDLKDTGKKKEFFLNATGHYSRVTIFDPEAKQKSISGFEVVENQNLHALKKEGIDFLIICTDEMLPVAEKIAELHRRHQGISVGVVTARKVFNEFSGGTPNPMAYRGMVKMLYESGAGKLKNVLFIGPFYADYRKATSDKSNPEGHIGFQDTAVSFSADAAFMPDFYGITADTVKSLSSLQNEEVNVGVGILPFLDIAEASGYLNKIEDYLNLDDFSPIANKMMIVGGIHDSHLHDTQAVKLSESYVDNYTPAPLQKWPLVIDAYGNTAARKKFMENLDKGCLWTFYFGHSGQGLLGKNTEFFSPADAMKLSNRYPGFFFVGGCDMTKPDLGQRGLGDIFVIDAPRGMTGVICSTRTAWSAQNYNLGKSLFTAMYSPDKGKSMRDRTPSVGEVYATAKTHDVTRNKNGYVYIGDPALPLPVPLRRVDIAIPEKESFAPGEIVSLQGIVLDNEGTRDKSFNGFATLRLAEPPCVRRSADYETAGQNGDVTIDVLYDAEIISEYKGEVREGIFTVEVSVPESASFFTGESMGIYAGVYDPLKRLSGNGKGSLTVGEGPFPSGIIDREAPVISAFYDNSFDFIEITVYDNISLPQDCLSATGGSGTLEWFSIPKASDNDSEKRFYINAGNFSFGENRLSLKAYDMAGNTAEYSLDFTRTGQEAPLSVGIKSKAVVGLAEFDIAGGSSVKSLIICDYSGKQIKKIESVNGKAIWNCTDSSGKKVDPGLYRAKAVDNSCLPFAWYSKWITFGVLDPDGTEMQ